MARTAPAAATSFSTKIGNGAMEKFAFYSQWRSELFNPHFSFFFINWKGRNECPRLWKLRKELLTDVRIFCPPLATV
jgi:hypothetical protein